MRWWHSLRVRKQWLRLNTYFWNFWIKVTENNTTSVTIFYCCLVGLNFYCRFDSIFRFTVDKEDYSYMEQNLARKQDEMRMIMEENYRQDNMSVKKVWVKSFSVSSNFSESEDDWTVVKYSIIIMTFDQVVSIQLIASCGQFFLNHTNYFIAVLFYPKVWLCLHILYGTYRLQAYNSATVLLFHFLAAFIWMNRRTRKCACLFLGDFISHLWYRVREEQWAYIPCRQFSFCSYYVTYLYEKISQLLSFCFLFLLDIRELDISQYIPVVCIFYGNRRESLKIFYHRLHFYSIIYPSTSIYRTLIVAGRIQKLY